MSFPYKDNTNTGGECLCESCIFSGANKNTYYICNRENSFHANVGICNKYQERTKNNG